ncbi:C-C motif chemokine 22 [Ochotona curzoniae]|uniref:C-C motif chemokine 22 n=1 Tax=Ochotona curzoniae TaxID=130825 RepID=UPI001B34A405|nr:C-C motif chemokine 22 [Ochotona curzoniae]
MASLQASFLAAFILLAMILQAVEAGPYGANVEDSICCQGYMRRPLHQRVVRNFYWTSNSCRKPGVVLVTNRHLEICADPDAPWVKKILLRLKK